MSTPRHIKEARMRAHQEEKKRKELEALFASVKKTSSKRLEFVAYSPAVTFTRETPNYPSLSNGIAGFAPKKEPQKYTGTLIKGIATMHKSNAVPIINKEQAEEISHMRR